MDVSELAFEYLFEAERIFGKRIDDWKFNGVEINDLFPHVRYYPDSGSITVSLSNKVINDELQCKFQLAHEVCHCLYPKKDIVTLEDDKHNVLNEGLSTFFSLHILRNNGSVNDVIDNLRVHNSKYFLAFKLTNSLIMLDNDIIKKIRQIEPKINRVKPEYFVLNGITDNVLITSLLNEF